MAAAWHCVGAIFLPQHLLPAKLAIIFICYQRFFYEKNMGGTYCGWCYHLLPAVILRLPPTACF
jgi:hypothetical protein